MIGRDEWIRHVQLDDDEEEVDDEEDDESDDDGGVVGSASKRAMRVFAYSVMMELSG